MYFTTCLCQFGDLYSDYCIIFSSPALWVKYTSCESLCPQVLYFVEAVTYAGVTIKVKISQTAHYELVHHERKWKPDKLNHVECRFTKITQLLTCLKVWLKKVNIDESMRTPDIYNFKVCFRSSSRHPMGTPAAELRSILSELHIRELPDDWGPPIFTLLRCDIQRYIERRIPV